MVELLATSATKEGIIKMINNYWYRNVIRLLPIKGTEEKYHVMIGEKITDFTVTKLKNRYRFEG
jgi:hypothetical protein